jgi:4-hydroxy-tetrahydrodipicolinate synthase
MKTPFPDWMPAGVIPAALLPFSEDYAIDERCAVDHLRILASVRGVAAITVNGHASEVSACTFDEQRRLLDLALDEIGHKVPIISGVFADSALAAMRIARAAEQAGASALLVFPQPTMAMGGQLRPEMAINHFRLIADASSLPLIAFQYSAASGLAYSFDTMLAMFESVPSIRAIKDWSEPMVHERNVRTFQRLDRPVNVLSTNSSWLMSSLVMGCKGVLSGAGSIVAAQQVELFEAVRRNDLAAARAVNDRLYPLQQAFYAPPFLDMHNRMKEALVMLGQFRSATVRPPLLKLDANEIERVRAALTDSGLLNAEARSQWNRSASDR